MADEHEFTRRLAAGPPLVLDGGLATELEARGHDISGALWSARLLADDPDAIVSAHLAYLDAGADVLISASYQASRAGFHQLGIDGDEADRLIVSSVDLARAAIDAHAQARRNTGRRYVAASVGPYGAVLADGSEYTGDYGVSRNVLRQFHQHRLRILDAAGADVLACETLPSRVEAMVFAELLTDTATPAWVSFCCRDGVAIADGTPIDEVALYFRDHPGVVALGVNCTAPAHVEPLIAKLRAAAPSKAIVVYPNSGERYVADGNEWAPGDDDFDFATGAAAWAQAGARMIGGCCRVGPNRIRTIADTLRARDD